MTYLITQTFILLLVAGLLGLVLGWYLTRIAANSARATMQSRLDAAEADARELRVELDAAVTARGQAEAERQQLAARVAELETAVSDAADDTALDDLQRELDTCREQLDAAMAPVAETQAANAPAGEPIAKVSTAAALAAAALDDNGAGRHAAAAPVAEAVAGDPDNLQQIKGIGPKIAGILDELGIRRFEQIAAWSPENVAWVNERLQFKGRIEREDWIPQAKALIAARDSE